MLTTSAHSFTSLAYPFWSPYFPLTAPRIAGVAEVYSRASGEAGSFPNPLSHGESIVIGARAFRGSPFPAPLPLLRGRPRKSNREPAAPASRCLSAHPNAHTHTYEPLTGKTSRAGRLFAEHGPLSVLQCSQGSLIFLSKIRIGKWRFWN